MLVVLQLAWASVNCSVKPSSIIHALASPNCSSQTECTISEAHTVHCHVQPWHVRLCVHAFHVPAVHVSPIAATKMLYMLCMLRRLVAASLHDDALAVA